MSAKLLFVDDEPNLLEALRRQLRGRFEMETALSGAQGLQAIAEQGPFAVVVSDLKMPEMNGMEFLRRVREVSPDSVRLLLTGQADVESAIAAINEGKVFRFLTKPCPVDALVPVLADALEQHRLVIAERELIEGTLSGAVKVLTEVLGLVNNAAQGKAARIERYVVAVAQELDLPERWQLRLAAMLSQIGWVALPAETLTKVDGGGSLDETEQQMVQRHPEIAAALLTNIPRLDTVARMISRQSTGADVAALPDDLRAWSAETLGAELLRAALEFDRLLGQGASHGQALERMRQVTPRFATPMVQALRDVEVAEDQMEARSVTVAGLCVRMVLDQDVHTQGGLMLVKRGQEVNEATLVRLRNFEQNTGIVQPIRVLVPRRVGATKA